MMKEWELLVDSIDDAFAAVELMQFHDTGRGLGALRDLEPGDLLLKVPLSHCLRSVRHCHLSPMQSLVYQLLDLKKSHDIKMKRYLDCLPQSYGLPVFEDRSFERLPEWIKQDFLIQKSRIQQDYKVIRRELPSLDIQEFRWAWCAVNTRCLSLAGSSDIALIPLFDMFNHSESMRSDENGGLHFRIDSQYFRMYSTRRYQRGEQVFIAYGAHDSLFMLREYGFYPAAGSIYDFILLDNYFDIQSLFEDDSRKLEMLNACCFDQDYTVTRYDGVSWKLLSAVRLLFCTEQKDFDRWKQSADGVCDDVSMENELKVYHYLNELFEKVERDLTHCINDPLVSDSFKCILKNLIKFIPQT